MVKMMVRMVKMMRMMLPWRLKQNNSLTRHDNGDDDDDDDDDDNDYGEADYGKDDEDDASLEGKNNPKRHKPQTYKRFSFCDASCS